MNSSIAAERRVCPDRRRSATPLLALFNPRGRRRGFRRDGEGDNQYVDRLAAKTVLVAIIVVVLSCLDALFTLIHLENGGAEANPIMEAALLESVHAFLLIKAALTVLGVGVLAAHQNFRVGARAMFFILWGYIGLTLYHCLLFAQVL